MEQKSAGAIEIEKMSKEDFHHRILRGPARLSEFSTIIVAGASALTVSEKKTIRNALAEAGIPLSLTESDDDLQDVAIEIAGRSVELR